MLNFSCGIDFGTTNSSAAISNGSVKPTLVEVEGDSVTIPSALFFKAPNNDVCYGRKAMQMYMDGEQGRCMRSLKRVLGTNLMSTGTIVGSETMQFEKIIAYFLQNIKNKIDAAVGMNIENVVMGRPVHFRDHDPDGDLRAENELRRVAMSVGFRNVEFQFEPIAAAFAHETSLEGEKLACVVDIGGGTSDFSIIHLGKKLAAKQDRKNDILANTGVRIGGNDFDKALSIKAFMPELGMGTTYGGSSKFDQELPMPTHQFFDLSEWSSINSLYNYKTISSVRKNLFNSNEPEKYARLLEIMENENGHKLLTAVEDTKIKLTKNDFAEVVLEFMSDKSLIRADKKSFEDAISVDMKKVAKSVEECLRQAQVLADDIGLVILTGGSTEVPYVRNCLCSFFPEAEISQENKLSSVGLGLAYDSARKFGM